MNTTITEKAITPTRIDKVIVCVSNPTGCVTLVIAEPDERWTILFLAKQVIRYSISSKCWIYESTQYESIGIKRLVDMEEFKTVFYLSMVITRRTFKVYCLSLTRLVLTENSFSFHLVWKVVIAMSLSFLTFQTTRKIVAVSQAPWFGACTDTGEQNVTSISERNTKLVQ